MKSSRSKEHLFRDLTFPDISNAFTQCVGKNDIFKLNPKANADSFFSIFKDVFYVVENKSSVLNRREIVKLSVDKFSDGTKRRMCIVFCKMLETLGF